MQDENGMFFFSGYFDAINAIKTKSGKWDMVKAVYLYSTQGVLPDEKLALDSVFLLIKAIIDGRNKKSKKGGNVDEKEDVGNNKTSYESSVLSSEKVAEVSSKSASVKKVTTAGNKNKNKNKNTNKNINKNKKEIEKEIIKEKEQEKSSSSSSSCSGECLQILVEDEEEDRKKKNSSFVKTKKQLSENIEKRKLIVDCANVPTFDQVVHFIDDAGLSVSPEAFYSYYQAKDWKINGEDIKDWRACALTWNKMLDMSKNSSKTSSGSSLKTSNSKSQARLIEYRGKKYTPAEFDKMFFDSLDNFDV